MEQQIIHPSAIAARPHATAAAPEAARTEEKSHTYDMLVGIGAILLGWSIVAMWLLLFISCVLGTRGFLNTWL